MNVPHTLILERSTNSLQHSVLNFRTLVHQMEVLSACLSDQPGITLVVINVRANVLPQLPEDKGASREVQSCETWVRDDLGSNVCGRTGNELDDARGYTGFFEDFVDDIVGIGGCG